MKTHAPILSVALSLLALASWLIPGAGEALQFDRAALARGENWRLLSGHVTHWTASHLLWDVAAFALLGALVERRSRGLLLTVLASGALAISGAVWFLAPELATYRGLSGVDSALFAAVLGLSLRDAIARHSWSGAIVPVIAGLAFIGKVAVEMLSASPLFVAADASFVAVPLAHLVGAIAGVAVVLGSCAMRARHSRSANAAHVVAACPCGSPIGRLRSM